MKTALILLVTVAFASAVQIADPFADRSLSSVATKAVEGIREQMPCGFPGMGIPSLAPLKIAHREVNFDHPDFSLHGSVNNFHLNGLNDFDIGEMRINALTSKVTFRFIFRNVNVDTDYDLRLMLKKAGFTINMVGAGPGKFAIKNMQIWGTMKYSLGVISRKLKLKSLNVRTHIDEVESDIQGILGEGAINHKLNDVLAEAVEIGVNENEDVIARTIEAIAVPAVNSALEDVSLGDLISAGGDGSEKEACIPPEF